MSEVVQIKNVTKTFQLSNKQMRLNNTRERTKVAVNNLSFSVKKGTIYGLLGSNGAGKTTTLRMISTLIKPDSGEILVDGISVVQDPLQVRRKIAFLTSDLKLDPFFTPSYLFNYYGTLRGLNKEYINSRRIVLFNKFGINDFSEVKVSELSTGMAQKASLAISLVHDPDIIIFDEPTNGLDVLTAKVILDYILELKQQGKTIILSSHIFSLIEKTCDYVGIIINGKMALEGLMSKLTENKQLEDVFFDLYERIEGEV